MSRPTINMDGGEGTITVGADTYAVCVAWGADEDGNVYQVTSPTGATMLVSETDHDRLGAVISAVVEWSA